jgi:hypothetical protein
MAKKLSMVEAFQLLKEGILEGSWEKVGEAYEGLTGEKPVKKKGRPKKGAKLLIPTEEEVEEFEESERLPKHVNTFKDDGRLAQKDRDFDKKYPLPVSKRRSAAQKVEVTCRQCHKTEKIWAHLIVRGVGAGERSTHLCNACCCGQ